MAGAWEDRRYLWVGSKGAADWSWRCTVGSVIKNRVFFRQIRADSTRYKEIMKFKPEAVRSVGCIVDVGNGGVRIAGIIQGSSIAPVMALSAHEGFSAVLPSSGEPSIVHATRMGGRRSCDGSQDRVSSEKEKGVVLDFAKLTAQGWVEAQDTVFSSRDWVGLGGNVAVRKDDTGPIAEVFAPLGEHGDLSVWVRLDCRVGGHDKHGMKGNMCRMGVRDG